ncbi:hypothetical protein [Microseira sp. BLCC-F43]|uniref:hypothetical protein n=1 Tax=Microseira sp. BLCC-F43 TaxID=3153602 RepID=UPI0035B8DD99
MTNQRNQRSLLQKHKPPQDWGGFFYGVGDDRSPSLLDAPLQLRIGRLRDWVYPIVDTCGRVGINQILRRIAGIADQRYDDFPLKRLGGSFYHARNWEIKMLSSVGNSDCNSLCRQFAWS